MQGYIFYRNMNESTVITSMWSTAVPTPAKTTSIQQSQFSITPMITATRIILFLILFAVVFGNSLVLVTTWLDKRLHQPNKYFIACLAVADLLVGCFSIPIRLHMYFNPLALLPIQLCRFWTWIDLLCEVASITTLTVISADRYFKISQPFKYRVRMRSKKCAILIVNIWLIAAVTATLGISPLGGSTGVKSIPGSGCINDNKIYYTIVSVLFFFVPSLVIILMYGFIFYIAHERRMMSRRGELGQSLAPSKPIKKGNELRQELKTVCMLSLVVFTFIFCWGPFFILLLIRMYKVEYINLLPKDVYEIIGNIFLIILPPFNSLCNPVIYACFDREYNNAFKHILKRYVFCSLLSRTNTQTSTSSTTRRTDLTKKESSPKLMFELQDIQ